jgi:hypothetical protein
MKRKTLAVLCVCLISFGGVNCSRADDIKALDSVADVTLVRPGCFVATIIGTAFFVAALPIAAMSGSVKETAHTLVAEPAEATFTRPIGDFSSLK